MTDRDPKVAILQGIVAAYRVPFFQLMAKSYDITVFHSDEFDKNTSFGFKTFYLKKISIFNFNVQNFFKLYSAVKNYDSVVIMFDLWWICYVLLMVSPLRRKIILHGHRYSRNNYANKVRNVLMRLTAASVLYGDEDVDELKRHFDFKKIFIAPNTVQVDNSVDTSSYKKCSFLYIGRLQSRKNIDSLIKSFANIIDAIPAEFNLDIIGDGEERKNLEKIAHQYNLKKRVIFHGEIREPKLLLPLFVSFALLNTFEL